MKKILIALIFGFVFLPVTTSAQKWIEPYTKSDGTKVEGHWRTPEEGRQESASQTKMINPYTGQMNSYDNRYRGSNPTNPYPNALPPFGPYDGRIRR
jgi:hypothetical protein